jgi:oligopeptide transport system ATP-binding protein
VTDDRPVVVSAHEVSVHLPAAGGQGVVRPVDEVSLQVRAGETLGLVGESGCGKSTLGRALLVLQRPTEGRVVVRGVDWTTLGRRALRRERRHAQLIFQDPYASFDPRRTIGAALAVPVRRYGALLPGLAPSGERGVGRAVAGLLEMVELDHRLAERRPHECSGGQLQRVAVARALATRPDFLVADEPTSALDVSVQAQMMNLMSDLQDRFALAYLFVSHNLAVVRQVSNRVAVMYLGKIVELATCEQLFETPLHPYTDTLVSAVPMPEPARERERMRITIRGDVPSLLEPPSGCHFHPRCPRAMEVCRVQRPVLTRLDDGRQVACHLYPAPAPAP